MRSLTSRHFLLALGVGLLPSLTSTFGCSSSNPGIFIDGGEDGPTAPVATGSMTATTTGTETMVGTGTVIGTGTVMGTGTATVIGTGTMTGTTTSTLLTTGTASVMMTETATETETSSGPPDSGQEPPPVDSGHSPPVDSGHSPPVDSGHSPPVDSGGGDTDAGPPTFTNIFTTIFPYYGCTGCHSGGGMGGLTLGTQAEAYKNLVGAAATSPCSGERVIAGDAAKSLLYELVADTNPPCGSQMPLDGAHLSPDDLQVIEDWINDGAQNN